MMYEQQQKALGYLEEEELWKESEDGRKDGNM